MWGPEDGIPVGYTNSSRGHQMDEIDRSIYRQIEPSGKLLLHLVQSTS
jgi:hypothetical protein